MFRDTGLTLVSGFELASIDRNKSIKQNSYNSWKTLEGDPLARENLEFRLNHVVQLLLRSEGGDAQAREELKAIG